MLDAFLLGYFVGVLAVAAIGDVRHALRAPKARQELVEQHAEWRRVGRVVH